MKIKEDVSKRLEAGFLEVDYLDWLANVIHMPKKDRKIRMCVTMGF